MSNYIAIAISLLSLALCAYTVIVIHKANELVEKANRNMISRAQKKYVEQKAEPVHKANSYIDRMDL